ncbi:MAG TPA: DUF6152 family protein [Gammaproteobacteria bacterium]|nr:DUF6152 family protein [Gammaproteobacteria bacterium]
MTVRGSAAALAAVVFGLAAMSASGHHSISAEFDRSQHIRLVGVIRRLTWAYPHTYFQLELMQPRGTEWRLESLPTAMFAKAGLTKEKLLAGEKVTVDALRSRDPKQRFAWVLSIEYPDGQCFHLDDERPQAKQRASS